MTSRDSDAPRPSDDGSGTGSPAPPIDGSVAGEDVKLFSAFAAIVRDKFTGADQAKRLDEMYKSPDYETEKSLLKRMNNNGMLPALITGIATFAFLRRGPRYMASELARREGLKNSGMSGGTGAAPGGAGGYRFDSPAGGGGGGGGGGAARGSPFGGPGTAPPAGGIVFRFIKFGVDLFVSIGVATFASSLFADKRRLMKDASEIPLVEGRSMLSDELCPDFVRQYNEIPPETWDRYRGRVRAMDAIEGFVLNCRRREMFERQLKEERGLRPGGTADHVVIPAPGVPKDLEVTIDDVRGGGQAGNGTSRASEGDFPEDYFAGEGIDSESENDHVDEWSSVDDFEKDEADNRPDENEGSGKRPRWGW